MKYIGQFITLSWRYYQVCIRTLITMLTTTYKKLLNEFQSIIPKEQIITDEFQTYALGTDAGFYRLTPKIVVKVESEEEVIQVIRACNSNNIPFLSSVNKIATSSWVVVDVGQRK